ncbi:hypothetical protein V1278_002281 [Bradyrhizobium sp. AZCC 1577]
MINEQAAAYWIPRRSLSSGSPKAMAGHDDLDFLIVIGTDLNPM